jgi:hypothetical protein
VLPNQLVQAVVRDRAVAVSIDIGSVFFTRCFATLLRLERQISVARLT